MSARAPHVPIHNLCHAHGVSCGIYRDTRRTFPHGLVPEQTDARTASIGHEYRVQARALTTAQNTHIVKYYCSSSVAPHPIALRAPRHPPTTRPPATRGGTVPPPSPRKMRWTRQGAANMAHRSDTSDSPALPRRPNTRPRAPANGPQSDATTPAGSPACISKFTGSKNKKQRQLLRSPLPSGRRRGSPSQNLLGSRDDRLVPDYTNSNKNSTPKHSPAAAGPPEAHRSDPIATTAIDTPCPSPLGRSA